MLTLIACRPCVGLKENQMSLNNPGTKDERIVKEEIPSNIAASNASGF